MVIVGGSVQELLSIGGTESQLLFDATDADALEEADFVDDRAVQMRDHSKLADALDSLKRGARHAAEETAGRGGGIPVLTDDAMHGAQTTQGLPPIPHREFQPVLASGGMTQGELDHLERAGPKLVENLDYTDAYISSLLTAAAKRAEGTSDTESVRLLFNASLDLKRASASFRAVVEAMPLTPLMKQTPELQHMGGVANDDPGAATMHHRTVGEADPYLEFVDGGKI